MSKQKVKNFAPEMLELFKRANSSRIELPMEKKAALYYRQRLNKLRVAMREENHPLLPLAEGVHITIETGIGQNQEAGRENVTYLVAQPADLPLIRALQEAGIEVSESELPTPQPKPSAPSLDPAPLALEQFMSKKSKPKPKE